MRKLTAMTFVSLDGVMQAPGGPEEDRDGGFEHGGWAVPHFDEAMIEVIGGLTARGRVAAGPRDLRDVRGHVAAGQARRSDRCEAERHAEVVASRTLDAVSWTNATPLTGDTATAVEALKSGDGGEIQVHGSAGLLQTLLEHAAVAFALPVRRRQAQQHRSRQKTRHDRPPLHERRRTPGGPD